MNEIHEGSCQLNFIPKRSFILVSLIFLRYKLTKIFTAFAISLPNFVKSPGEEVRKSNALNKAAQYMTTGKRRFIKNIFSSSQFNIICKHDFAR